MFWRHARDALTIENNEVAWCVQVVSLWASHGRRCLTPNAVPFRRGPLLAVAWNGLFGHPARLVPIVATTLHVPHNDFLGVATTSGHLGASLSILSLSACLFPEVSGRSSW